MTEVVICLILKAQTGDKENYQFCIFNVNTFLHNMIAPPPSIFEADIEYLDLFPFTVYPSSPNNGID